MGLTKEEKKALKLAKKLEKARLEAEAKRTRKIEELDRELAAHEMQNVELQTRLQTMIVRTKEPIYKQNIYVMSSAFQRTIDKKDSLINLIMQLKRIGNNQYGLTIASFSQTVDGIMNTFLADLEAMCKETDLKTKALVQKGKEEMAYIMEYRKNAETHLSILLYHSHELADSLAWTIRGENFVKLDEDTNKYLEIRDSLRAILEGLYSAMWEEFKLTLKNYIIGSAENQKHLRVLRKKEAMMADIIAIQAKKIAASEGVIRRLRLELANYESGTKQAGFRDRRNRHKDAFVALKRCLLEGMKKDETQLSRLVVCSNGSIKYLETAFNKSEKILQMAALCRKLETQYEKVLPFGSSAMTYDSTQSKKIERRSVSEDSLVANTVATTCGLKRLWQRISKVELSKRALDREKILLEQENASMMRILEMRGETKFSAQSIKYKCGSKPSKRSIDQPHAVDGSLEARKIYRFY